MNQIAIYKLPIKYSEINKQDAIKNLEYNNLYYLEVPPEDI